MPADFCLVSNKIMLENPYTNLIKTGSKKGLIKMEVDLIFKIAAIGIIVAVLNQLLKRAEREEQAMMTTLAGLIVVLMMIVNQIGDLFETIKKIFGLY